MVRRHELGVAGRRIGARAVGADCFVRATHSQILRGASISTAKDPFSYNEKSTHSALLKFSNDAKFAGVETGAPDGLLAEFGDHR